MAWSPLLAGCPAHEPIQGNRLRSSSAATGCQKGTCRNSSSTDANLRPIGAKPHAKAAIQQQVGHEISTESLLRASRYPELPNRLDQTPRKCVRAIDLRCRQASLGRSSSGLGPRSEGLRSSVCRQCAVERSFDSWAQRVGSCAVSHSSDGIGKLGLGQAPTRHATSEAGAGRRSCNAARTKAAGPGLGPPEGRPRHVRLGGTMPSPTSRLL